MAEQAFKYDPFSPAAMKNPQAFYNVLREEHPAYFIPEYDTYVFSRYEDVWEAFVDTEHFSEAEGQLFARDALLQHHRGDPPKPQIDPQKSMFLFLDPPVHTKFRRALWKPFMKSSVQGMGDFLKELVQGRLKELLPRGRFDLNGDYGSYVSVRAAAELMGLPLEDPEHVVDLINRMVARDPDSPGATEDGQAARMELMEWLAGAAARRRAGIGEESPVIDPLIQSDLIGRPLTDAEIAVDLLGIIVGGTETVPKVISGGLLELQNRPDQLAAVRADLDRNIEPAYEEMLRYLAPAQWFGRTVKKRHERAGILLEEGQRVILLIASANRDKREFDAPDEFVWNRDARRMLSFGVGAHFCIGIHLARLEGQTLLREFLRACPDFSVLPEEGHWAESEFQIGWTKLPVDVSA